MLFTAAWGLRLVLARGHEQLMARAVFLPIALAVAAVWCATLVPGESWQPVTGLGGVFGDTVLGAVVNALPMSAGAGVRLMSLLMLVASMAIFGFVLGVSWREMQRFLTFTISGIVLLYAGLVVLLRGGVGQGVKSAQRAGGAMLDHARQKSASARYAARSRSRNAASSPCTDPRLARAAPVGGPCCRASRATCYPRHARFCATAGHGTPRARAAVEHPCACAIRG